MLITAGFLLTLLLPAFAAPLKLSVELDKREGGKPDWIRQAEQAHWDCVAGSSKRLDTMGDMNLCLEGLVRDAVDYAKAANPGNNVFALRTDLGMTWNVESLTTRASFASKQWDSEEPLSYDVIVFKGKGTLHFNGNRFKHLRNWSAPYSEKPDEVDFDEIKA